MLRSVSSAIVIVMLAAGVARASDREDFQAVVWASACFSCHGPEGRSEGGMPPLASLPADIIYKTMNDFRSGARPATVMHQHARGYTDEQLRRIADVLGTKVN